MMVADLDAMEGVLGVVDPVAASDAPLGVEPPNPSGLGDIVAQLQSHHASPGPLSLRGYQDNWDMKRQLEERLSRREICELAQWYHLTLELLLGSLVNCLRLDPDRMARFADNMPTPVHRTFFSAVLPFPSMRPVDSLRDLLVHHQSEVVIDTSDALQEALSARTFSQIVLYMMTQCEMLLDELTDLNGYVVSTLFSEHANINLNLKSNFHIRDYYLLQSCAVQSDFERSTVLRGCVVWNSWMAVRMILFLDANPTPWCPFLLTYIHTQ